MNEHDIKHGVASHHAAALLRLHGEALEFATDKQSQVRHVMTSLAKLVRADVAGELEIAPKPGGFELMRSVDVGWSNSENLAVLQRFYREKGFGANPFANRMISVAATQPCRTALRSDLVADEEWYSSEFYRQVYEPLGLNDSIYSVRIEGRGKLSALGLSRQFGSLEFSTEERSLVELFHTTLLPVLSRSERTNSEAIERLTAREFEVYDLLISGAADKDIAGRLEISRNTASQHVSTVLRKLGFASRIELLSHTARTKNEQLEHFCDAEGANSR